MIIKNFRFYCWLIITLLIACTASGGAIYYSLQRSKIAPIAGKTIGGNFQLLSPSGNKVNDGIFRGKWMLMYFGASRCPNDQCRQDLDKIGKIINELGYNKTNIAPIFISYDLSYDTPDRLMLYMKEFNPRIIALTGGELALRDIAILYQTPIKWQKINSEISYIEPSRKLIIMDPLGNYKTSLNIDENTPQLTNQLKKLMTQ